MNHSAADVALLVGLELLIEWFVVAHLPSLAAGGRFKCLKVDLHGVLMSEPLSGLTGCAFLPSFIKCADNSWQRSQVLNK